MSRIVQGVIVFCAFLAMITGAFLHWHEAIFSFISGQPEYTVFVNEVGITVTVADEKEEWQQGLSGTESLPEMEGKLFVFDESDYYGIWMKDMNYPLDIIWINEYLQIVHIEEKVSPDTYPKTFSNQEPARFVLEVNAYTAESFDWEVGQEVSLPYAVIPADIRENL